MRHCGLGIATLPVPSRCLHTRVPAPSRALPCHSTARAISFSRLNAPHNGTRISRTRSEAERVGWMRLLGGVFAIPRFHPAMKLVTIGTALPNSFRTFTANLFLSKLVIISKALRVSLLALALSIAATILRKSLITSDAEVP